MGSHLTARRRCPSFHGKMKLKPGPRKKDADDHEHGPEHEEDREEGDGELAVLRLVARVLVDVGGEDQHEEAHARDGHAGDHRVEHREQLLQAEEVPRRLRRVRRAVGVGQLQQRCVHEDREHEQERRARRGRPRTRPPAGGARCAPCRSAWPSRPGWSPTCTTVSRRWVWPPGPVPTGTPPSAGAAVTSPVGRSATATPPPPPLRRRRRRPRPLPAGRGLGGPAALEQVGGDARRGLGRRALRPPPRRRQVPRPRPAAPLRPWPRGLGPASSARLRRCSGISVTAGSSRCGRSGDHRGPEMPPSLRTRQKWIAMKITMTNGSISTCSTYHRSSVSAADLDAAEQHEAHLVAEHRRVAHHVGAHRDRPQRQLVPRQQVAGERQQQREREQDDPDHPVELPGRLVGPVVEDPRHVQEHREHHEVGAPIGACCAPAARTSPRSAACRCRSRPGPWWAGRRTSGRCR